MPYAVLDDIAVIYSDDALYVADRNHDGIIDSSAVDRALEAASIEMDGYLGVRYDLPFKTAPAILKQPCIDIALYRLAQSRDVQSEEHRKRYDDAIRLMDRLAKGTASLNLPPAADGTPPTPSPNTVKTQSGEKHFTRQNMAGL